MARQYVVYVEDIGELVKTEDTIAAAREWARLGFPGRQTSVRVHTDAPLCQCCGSRPCVYGRRKAAR